MEVIETEDPPAKELNSDECTHIYEIKVGNGSAIYWIGADCPKSAVSWVPEDIGWDRPLTVRALSLEEANNLTVKGANDELRRMSAYFNEHPRAGGLICSTEY